MFKTIDDLNFGDMSVCLMRIKVISDNNTTSQIKIYLKNRNDNHFINHSQSYCVKQNVSPYYVICINLYEPMFHMEPQSAWYIPGVQGSP